jgi:hypothetical protein
MAQHQGPCQQGFTNRSCEKLPEPNHLGKHPTVPRLRTRQESLRQEKE